MKKIILSILFGFMVIPTTYVFATSGACSSHGGVSCSLSNASKSVICNDGWSDSSTTYDNLVECKNTACDTGSVTAYQASRGLIGSSFGSAMTQQCDNNNTSINNTNAYNNVTNYYDSSLSQDNLINEAVNRKMQEYCIEKRGNFSVYNSSTNICGCTGGYSAGKDGICLPESEALQYQCESSFGANSVADISSGKCNCRAGYQFSGSPSTCTFMQSFDTKDEMCKAVSGPHSIATDINGNESFKCGCESGYQILGSYPSPCTLIPPVVIKKTNTNTLSSNSEPSKTLATSSLSKNTPSNNTLSSSSTATVTSSTQILPRKVSWFWRFINWFR